MLEFGWFGSVKQKLHFFFCFRRPGEEEGENSFATDKQEFFFNGNVRLNEPYGLSLCFQG